MYTVLPAKELESFTLSVAFPDESALAVPINDGLLRLSDFPLHTPLVMEVVPVLIE